MHRNKLLTAYLCHISKGPAYLYLPAEGVSCMDQPQAQHACRQALSQKYLMAGSSCNQEDVQELTEFIIRVL
jgi:hypothetical protein